MEKGKEPFISQEDSNEIDHKNSPKRNQIVLFVVFLLIVDQFQRERNFSKEQGEGMAEDEYIVTMEHSPAFPLEKKNTYEEGQKIPILNVKGSQNFYHMVNTLKPYMSEKNQYMLSTFEKWKSLAEDLNKLSNFQGNETSLLAKSQPDTIINFLEDLRPFIHEDYYPQLQQVSNGIHKMLDIHQNILKLENTLETINNIPDNNQKINELLHGFEPFMNEIQRKKINQLESLYRMVDILKTVSESDIKNMQGDVSKNKPSQSNKDLSTILDLLDMLASSSSKDNTSQEKNSAPTTRIDSPEQEKLEASQHLEEPLYEEVFQEDVQTLEQLKKEAKEAEKKQEE